MKRDGIDCLLSSDKQVALLTIRQLNKISSVYLKVYF